MNSLLTLIAALSKAIDLLWWFVNKGREQLEAMAAKRRQESVAAAIESAKKAQTLEEKRKAACEIQKNLDPTSSCATPERSE